MHRIGQTNACNIHFLLVRGSVDEIMWETIQHKLDNVGMVLDGKEDGLQVAAVRKEQDRNQASLHAYMQPAAPAPAGQQQAQYEGAAASGSGRQLLQPRPQQPAQAPGAQATLHSFYAPKQQQQQPGAGPGVPNTNMALPPDSKKARLA